MAKSDSDTPMKIMQIQAGISGLSSNDQPLVSDDYVMPPINISPMELWLDDTNWVEGIAPYSYPKELRFWVVAYHGIMWVDHTRTPLIVTLN